MRLLKQNSREYNGKQYHKHWVVIPNEIVLKLGWNEGDELKAEVKGDKLVIEKD